jgi:hypothetical protein
MKSSLLYIVFSFFVIMFVTALAKRADQFRFRNGEPATPEQRDIALFVLLLLVVVSGYSAFKRAQFDWKLWKRKHSHNRGNGEHPGDSERQPK